MTSYCYVVMNNFVLPLATQCSRLNAKSAATSAYSHCEERIDAAIQFLTLRLVKATLHGLQRLARNDVITML
jgi:hypothetical protein